MSGRAPRATEPPDPSRQLLRRTGLRCTTARGIVLALLNRVARPLSHQEITGSPATRGLDRVTLYRTLTTLQEAGLLHRVQGIDGVWRFRAHGGHPGTCGGDHIHFLCLTCHQMSCLPEQALPWVQAPAGAEVFGKQLVVHGRCAPCGARQSRAVTPATGRPPPRAGRGRAPSQRAAPRRDEDPPARRQRARPT